MAKTKQYVKFLYPGAFFPESGVREVPNREASVEAPKGCFGYKFFERQETKAEDGEVLFGRPRNYSGTHYFGKVKTLDDIKREMPNQRTLISNMEENGWDKVVQTRRGNYEPFTEQDVSVAEE
ncbi:MAG: hypothetical protein AABX29_05520 [Nanoarchaeota archaeon]